MAERKAPLPILHRAGVCGAALLLLLTPLATRPSEPCGPRISASRHHGIPSTTGNSSMATSVRKVLLAVDGSDNAEYAFDWYVTNMHKDDNTLILLHCPETFANATMMSPGKVQELMVEMETKIKHIENKFSIKMKTLGISGKFVRRDGEKPGQTICECALEMGATYIVTGTRGLGKFRRTVMGSVSDYVIHHAHVPVLVVRHKEGKQ